MPQLTSVMKVDFFISQGCKQIMKQSNASKKNPQVQIKLIRKFLDKDKYTAT